MRCPRCSSEIADKSRFCAACGQPIPDPTMVTIDAAPSPCSPSPPPSVSKQVPPSQVSPTATGLRSTLVSQISGRFAPGTVLAERYRITGMLGRGGMGEVYRADDLTLDQVVALKFLPEKVAQDPERRERFYKEVRIARQISHGNVCRIYDIGQTDGQHFTSMEYIDGEDLGSLLRRIGRLPADKAVEISRQMCAGLAAAHEKGVLHRDLKPANIMIDGTGTVRIADFGLAGAIEDTASSTVLEGTPAYMAPEQFAGKGASVRSDIYALGLVMYELFTGKQAFKGPNVLEVARLHRESTPTNPSTLITDMDPIVERVILRCLEKDPAMRPASALAVAAALPGGDPLAAALAAGETPSPEMVAAAGDEGALAPPFAWAALAYILLALVGVTALSRSTAILSWIPQPKSPEALAERSRELIRTFGYTEEPSDFAYGYVETDFLGQMRQATDAREQLATGEPPALVFWYRQSARQITNQSYFYAGKIAWNAPPQHEPNTISVLLDGTGRLEYFRMMPRQLDGEAGTSPPDWGKLLSEAGFDISKLKAVPSAYPPPMFADVRVAWDGVYPRRSDIAVHIEAASYRGKPVLFQIYEPWNRPSATPAKRPERGVMVGMFVAMFIATVLCTGALAWRNLKLNRGDRRGALRFSFYLFVLEFVARLLQAHFVPDIGEVLGIAWMAAARALFFGAVVWLAYIALEPHIRRLWPHTMISWTRLLAGHLRDPRIGRDVLIGGAVGITFPLLEELAYLISARLGSPAAPALARLDSINAGLGLRNYLGDLFTHVTNALSSSIYMFLIFLLFRIVFRKDRFAVPAFVALLAANSALNSPNPYVSAAIYLVLFSALLFVMRSYGLLALMAVIVFLNLPASFPITTDLARWYANTTVFTMLFMGALAIYGFRTALGGRPAFAFDLLKD